MFGNFAACECDMTGSQSKNCDKSGQCECLPHIEGKKCDTCIPGFHGFPNCRGIYSKARIIAEDPTLILATKQKSI